MVDRGDWEDEGLAPPEKKLSSLPPKLAARIRRQKARQRLQERDQEVEGPAEEEAWVAPAGEPSGEEARGPEAPDLQASEEEAAPPSEVISEARPPEPDEPKASHREDAPLPLAALDIKPRKVPTVSGLFKELGRGAWESVSDFVDTSVRSFKRRRAALDTMDYLGISEDSLHHRRQKLRGYVLLSSAIHVLLFLPIIHMAMLQEPESKPPIYVRILETPPPAKTVEKKPTESKTTKTEERVNKVVEARGPQPEPQPVTRPTPTKTYASPKKVLVAKASRPPVEAPEAPKVPTPAPTQLEAPRPRTAVAPRPEESLDSVTAPTRPLTLPENYPKVAALSEDVQRRQAPVATRPTEVETQAPTVFDTEGRASRLNEAVPESFQVQDRLAAPTAAPPLPPSQRPAPTVLGQAATTVSGPAPESPAVPVPGQATSTARPVDERRTASTVVASLGGEAGPVSPEQVTLTDTRELGPVGSAPMEFREEITVPLNSDDPRFKEYLEAVKRRILEIWRYPDDAEPGLRGKVSIEFSIERDGSVSKVHVISASGYAALDRGATDAMRTASPFPPLPPEFNTNRLNVVGGFRYN